MILPGNSLFERADSGFFGGNFVIPVKPVPRSHNTAIFSVCAVFVVISWITVSLRFWTRAVIVKSIGYDDMVMLFTMVLPTA
jgi:hypothetical protein